MRRLALVLCLLWPSVAFGQVPEVAVTLKPLHSLTARLMSGIGSPNLIIRGGLSPHYYAPRPSETRALHRSDLVIWIGPSVEPGLAKTLQTLGPDVQILSLGKTPELNLWPARKGGNWSNLDQTAAHDPHFRGSKDPHFWLDPLRSATAAQVIAQSLIAADPANSSGYTANLTALTAELQDLDVELQDLYAPLSDAPLIVFHDAYLYLEKRYHLKVLGALTVSPDRAPGAKRVSQIREKILQAGVTCVLYEPQFKPALVRILTEGTSAQLGMIDPLGSNIPAGPDHYFDMMRASAASLRACLSSSTSG